MLDKKEELLQQLSILQSKPRADKGKHHKYVFAQTDVSVYHRIISRLLHRSNLQVQNGDIPVLPDTDDNGYYIPVDKRVIPSNRTYIQHYQGREIVHSITQKIIQKPLDLERYRFNALRELATGSETKHLPLKPDADVYNLLQLRYSLSRAQFNSLSTGNNLPSNMEWFATVYHISIYDVSTWDYDTWRTYYSCCPVGKLDNEFVFSRAYKPGTPEFMPEWAWYTSKQDKQSEQDKQDEITRKKNQFIANSHVKKGE